MGIDLKHSWDIDINEIDKLMKEPRVREFLVEKLAQAREMYRQESDRKEESAMKQADNIVNPRFKDGWSKKRSYFFELVRQKDPVDPSRYRWDLGRFRLTKRADIIKVILTRFIQKADDFPVSPEEQYETIEIAEPDRSLHFTFLKNRPDRVAGFVREILKGEKETETVDSQVIKITSKYLDIDKQVMYDRILRLMEENQQVREDIFFYVEMAEKYQKNTPSRKSRY